MTGRTDGRIDSQKIIVIIFARVNGFHIIAFLSNAYHFGSQYFCPDILRMIEPGDASVSRQPHLSTRLDSDSDSDRSGDCGGHKFLDIIVL